MLRRLSDLMTGQKSGPGTLLTRATGTGAASLRARRDAARRERITADRNAREAEALLRALQAAPPDTPDGALWADRPLAWRHAVAPASHVGPETGTEIGSDLTLFHDCPLAEITLRQTLAPIEPPVDATPDAASHIGALFALSLDTLRFQGSFLSLVLTLPEPIAAQFGMRDILAVKLTARMSAPTTLYGRLNLQQGPNTAQMLAEFPPLGNDQTEIAFDLAYGELRDLPVERIWLDLIVENPAMRRITVQDLVLSRHLRAEL